MLQPIHEVLESYNNPQASKKQRSKASGEWFKAFNQMQVVFQEAAEQCLDEDASRKFFVSGKTIDYGDAMYSLV